MSILTLMTKAKDIPVKDQHVKVLIQGKSGSGKTTLGANMPGRVAVLLTEANGLQSILAANPDALVVRAYDPASLGCTSSYEVVKEFMVLAGSGALDVDSVVCDSATEVQRIIKTEILREKGVADDPGYQFTQQDWGMLTERMRRFARMFRDIPYHTMMLTLSEEQRDEDGTLSAVVPQFEGRKLSGEIAQFFSAVGYAYKRTIKVEGQPDDVTFEVLFQGASKWLVKPIRPLKNVEKADPRDWIARIIDFAKAQAEGRAAPKSDEPKPEEPKPAESKPADAAESKTESEPAEPKPDADPKTVTTRRRTVAVQ